MKKKNWLFFVLLGMGMLLIFISIFAPFLVPNDPYVTNVLLAKQAPSGAYPFGTDTFGRCIFSRVLYGTRTSIFTALILVTVTTLFGTLIGTLCGYYGGGLDLAFRKISEILLSFPQMVLAVFVAGVFGGSMLNAMVAMAFAGWIQSAKLARTHVAAIKNETYIHAARLSGNSDFKIMFSYIMPHIIGRQIIQGTTEIGSMMIGIAGLSFLGLGVQAPTAEWGSMISDARSMFQTAPWGVFYPAVAIVITIMIFNGLGDCLRNRFNLKGN